ncbi:MAG: nuclear transport factor 2 family protein [Proteobacteria bacterium]|nr:nuclear transport factor 2 family protein [Pseudomonadota bacterium]MDA1071409.1 nuclear transport factor 2 family protein [Pseudomonadota bacterium]
MSHEATDEAAVRALAQDYYDTMVAADEAGIRRVFDSRAPVVGHFQGQLLWQDLDAFIAETCDFVGKHGKEESRIERVELHGDTAYAVVGGRYAELWFEDQLAMVKIDGNWRVVAKTFWVKPMT